jgi:transcriptional regulator with XRE-family HTH domain
MALETQPTPTSPWLSLRTTTGLSQREVERRLGWKRGHLSLIERGLPPTPDQAHALRTFYLNGATA